MISETVNYERSFHVEHPEMQTIEQCPVCSCESLGRTTNVTDHSISGKSFSIVECGACQFAFTSPRPDQQHIGVFYQSDTYISHTNSNKTWRDKINQLSRQWMVRRKHKAIHKYHPHGQLLDIGCGTGDFLAHQMSRGYLVTGVEPNLTARESAIAAHAIPVFPQIDLVPALEQFQVVTMWHVLEHVPEIRSTLKQVFARLADRGIFVIAVPDRESWDAKHYGPFWAAYDVPRHFWHFRQQDLFRLLKEHGFELVTTRRMWLDAFYIAMLSESYKGGNRLIGLVRAFAVGAWSNIIATFTRAPTSSTMYVVRKSKP